jgi:hypothetical protein
MRSFLVIGFLSIMVLSTRAQIPELVNYQGLLSDSAGTPINGSVSMVFSIYADSSGGNAIWTETHNSIAVVEGKFSVLLGSVDPLGDSIFDDSNRYLGIAVSGDPEMQPRTRISSAPYANITSSIKSSSGGTILLVGPASDTVQVDPYSGYAFRMTNDDGDERMLIEANDPEGPTISIKNPNGRYITLGSGDSTVCIHGSDGNMRVMIGIEAGGRIDGGGAVSVYDDSTRLAVSVTKDGLSIFDNSRSDTVAFFSTDGNIIGKGRISMGTDSLNGPWSTVFGQHCSAQGTGSTVSGGITNHAIGGVSTISGGTLHSCFGYGSTIGGGQNNHADSISDYSLVAGGRNNSIFAGQYATISGGYLNRAYGEGTTIGGGFEHYLNGTYSTISGGYADTISGLYSSIGGGFNNSIVGPYNTISGGRINQIDARYGTVGGGYSNQAGDDAADSAVCIGGGSDNSITEKFSFIGGGYNNSVAGGHSSILGGKANTVTNLTSVVCGGNSNQATGISSTVGGGYSNIAGGDRSFVGGGGSNQATGDYSCVSGGRLNEANGNYSKAGGRRAFANHDGVFIWADQKNFDFNSNAAGEFAVRSTGGVRFVTAIDSSGIPLIGVRVVAGGGSWQSLCDRDSKENFASIDEDKLLERLAALPIGSWNYKSQPDSIRHIGPTAQDFYSAFDVGEDEKHITAIDADGVALVGIKALLERINKLEARIAELEAER